MALHAYQLGQDLTEPARPESLEIPNLDSMSDQELIEFGENIYNKYLDDVSRVNIKEALKFECLRRIRRLLLTCSESNQYFEFENCALQLQALMKVYSFAIVGYPVNGSFNGPTHRWQNPELRDHVIKFFITDENLHNYDNLCPIMDYMHLFCQRITNG